MKLTEVELQGTSRAENIYFTWSLCSERGFGIPEVYNSLFGDFQKFTDLEIEEKKNVIKEQRNVKLTEVELRGTSRAENIYFTWSLYSKYGFGVPEV